MSVRHVATIPWQADAETTAAVLEAAVLDNIRHVRKCSVATEGPTLATAHVTVRWYAWATLGVLHFLTWRRVHRLAAYVAPVGVRVFVTVL